MKMKKLLAGLLSAAMVVTSVSFGGFGVNEVNATAAETTVNENNFIEFWESQHEANTLGTIEDTDRWLFQSKDNGQWANIEIKNTPHMWGYGHGDNSPCTGKRAGEFRRQADWDNKIVSNGFMKVNNAHESIAVSWKAPEAGYYKINEEGTATQKNDGRVEVWHVPAAETSSDGRWITDSNNADYQNDTIKICKMEAGDLFRVNTKRHNNNTMNYAGPTSDSSTLSWKVVPCTAKDYAVQWLPTVNADTTKPEALQNAVNKSKEALQAMVDATETADATIEQGIKDLEAAVARMNNYVAVTEVTVDNDEILNLTVGQTVTLTAKGNQDAYADVTYTLEGATEVLTQNSNVFTAATPGTATIKVASVYEPEVFKTVTVNVTANKDALTEKIAEAKKYLTGKYTEASITVLNDAITEAEKVVNSNTATEKDVNDAVTRLDEAIKGLDVLYTVNVTGGKLADGTTKADVVATTELTVTANPAPEGQKFSHWTVNGTPICYAKTYTFNVHYNIEVAAVYVDNVTEVKPEATIVCNVEANQATKVIKFTAKRSLPEGAVMKEHGMVMTNQAVWSSLYENNVEAFKLGAARTLTKKATTTGLLGNFSVSMRCKKANTWYAKGYVIYTYGDKEYTLYSNLVSDSIN